MFNKENSVDEILNAILKSRPLEEQVRVLRGLYIDAVEHSWVDEELRDNMLQGACKDYGVPYQEDTEE